MTFQLAHLHLTLAQSKGQSQSHAHFDCEYHPNDDIYGKGYNLTCMSHVAFKLAYLELTLTYSKGQLGNKKGVSSNIFTFLF